MLTYLFSALGIIMLVVLLVSFLMTGKLSEFNMHLAAYGFILAGIGYIIEALKKKDQTSADHLKYVLQKHNKELHEEIKTIRTLIFRAEERKPQQRSEMNTDNHHPIKADKLRM